MRTAKWTLVSTAAAAALGLALGLSAAPAEAHGDSDNCLHNNPDHKHCLPPSGDDDSKKSGKGLKLEVEIFAGDTILFDDDFNANNVYVDKEGAVTAATGGETQPNPPGFGVFLTGKGKDPRLVTVSNFCLVQDPPDYADRCSDLPGDLFVERHHVGWKAKPYQVNCPNEGDPECPDVFTMPADSSRLMNYNIGFTGAEAGFRIEFASAIGGASSVNPGRCLSLLNMVQQVAFLDEFCPVAGDCNVEVTVVGVDGDGRNNAWDVTGTGLTGLICDVEDGIVYGIYTGADVAWSAVEKP